MNNFGCSEQTTDSDFSAPQLKFLFAPSGTQQPNITKIIITVEGDDFETITHEIEVEEGVTRFTRKFFVPAGTNRRVTCEAYEADSTLPAFTGKTLTDVLGESPTITVTLNPTTVMVELTSSVTEVTVGETFVINLIVNNAVNLYVITAELEFDETIIEPIEAKNGGVLGADTVFVEDSAFARRPTGRLSIGLSRQGDVPGMDVSGAVSRITFRAKKAGNATVNIVKNESLFLEQPDGNPVPHFARMIDYLSRGDYSVTIK